MNQPALIVLRPGDKVLVTLAEEADDDACKAILARLRRSFRGCDFTILAGVTAVAVEPGLCTRANPGGPKSSHTQ